MNQLQIQKLIENSQQGDTKAFGLLVAEYQALVFRLAFRLLGDENQAEDLTQDVFVKSWLQIKQYKPQYRFSTWISKITVNLCYDRLRSMKDAPGINVRINANSGSDWASPEDIEASLINKELGELILSCTATLSPKQKLVFTLSDIEGLETADITAVTGLSAESIKSNLYLARKSIREKLNTIQ